MDAEKKKLINAKDMLIDMISGDDSIEDREDYKEFSIDVIKSAQRLIFENKNLSDSEKIYYMNNLWRVNYRGSKPPPTIEQFLTREYLGATVDGLYPYIRSYLMDYFNPQKEYRDAVLYLFTGAGKSYFSVISTLFVLTHLMLMKNPNRFFGLNSATEISQGYFSFTEDKVVDLLVAPTKLILEDSPKFIKCKTHEILKRREKEYGVDKFCWTPAKMGTSILTFSNGSTIKMGSNPSKLIGTQILTGVLSELTFASDFGMSQDDAMRLLNDLKSRIDTRFKGNYFARTIIDSSPNSLENKVDDYIVNHAPKETRPQLILKGAEWEYKTWDFEHIKETFEVFIGNSMHPPKMLEKNEVKHFDLNEVIHVPKTPELESSFKNDLIKALKDRAGIPAGSQDKLIYDNSKIERIFDNEELNNVYTCVFAPSAKPPEGLIWEQIKDKFFIKMGGFYEFYRYPKVKRYIAVDQSISGDTTGISMVHRETDKDGNVVYVADFNIAIPPNKDRINIDAIKLFIHDLRKKGKLNICGVSFDWTQSENTMQYLKREGFEVKKLSVDKTVTPYMNMINLINTGRIKAGKNIFLKNNLKSLIMTTRKKSGTKKVEHTLGDVSSNFGDTDWDKSRLGYNAKDVSDSFAGAIALCDELEKYFPTATYFTHEDDNSELSVAKHKGLEYRVELA